MLINVVILFIKDLLPIFILLCLISTNLPSDTMSLKRILITISMSCLGVVTTFIMLPIISELFGGLGIEILESIELIIIYCCLLFGSAYIVTQHQLTPLQVSLMMTGTIVFLITNSTQFIVFIDSYMAYGDAIKNIIIGLIIGFGICLSFSALLYFVMNFLKAKAYYSLTYLIWALFLTGNISQLINLLQQVDIVAGSEAIWDSTSIVKDSSEYGHLLKTLFGYETSPSLEFVVLYVVSLMIFLIYFLKYSPNKRQYVIDSPTNRTIDNTTNSAKENADVL